MRAQTGGFLLALMLLAGCSTGEPVEQGEPAAGAPASGDRPNDGAVLVPEGGGDAAGPQTAAPDPADVGSDQTQPGSTPPAAGADSIDPVEGLPPDGEGSAGAIPGGGAGGTPDRGWGTTFELGAGTKPSLAVDANGSAVVAWQQHDGTRSNIHARWYRADGGWESASLLEASGVPAQDPSAGIDASGNAIVAWWEGAQAQTFPVRSYAAVFDAQQRRWLTPTSVGIPCREADLEYSSLPRLAMDASGQATVVMAELECFRSAPVLSGNRYVPGAGWTGAEVLEFSGPWVEEVRPVMDGNGNAAVINLDEGGLGHYLVEVHNYVAGQGWRYGGMPYPHESIPFGHSDPAVAMSPDGQALALWVAHDHGGGHVEPENPRVAYASLYTPGAGWAEAVPIESNAVGERSTEPQIQFEAPARALAVWEQGRRLYTARFEGGIWSPEQPLDTRGEAHSPRLSLSNGSGFLLFQRGADELWAMRYAAGAWGLPQQLAASGTSFPQVGASANGTALAVWSAGGLVWARRFE